MLHYQPARTVADVGMLGSPRCCMKPHRAHLLAEEDEEVGDHSVGIQRGTLQVLGTRVEPLADEVLQPGVDQGATFLAVATPLPPRFVAFLHPSFAFYNHASSDPSFDSNCRPPSLLAWSLLQIQALKVQLRMP
jgi:hypothetical protein